MYVCSHRSTALYLNGSGNKLHVYKVTNQQPLLCVILDEHAQYILDNLCPIPPIIYLLLSVAKRFRGILAVHPCFQVVVTMDLSWYSHSDPWYTPLIRGTHIERCQWKNERRTLVLLRMRLCRDVIDGI